METPAQQRDRLSSVERQRVNGVSGRSDAIPLPPLGASPSTQRGSPDEESGRASRAHSRLFRRFGAGDRLVTVTARDNTGLVGLCQLQGHDPSHRIFAPYIEAASVVQWDMDNEIGQAYDNLCDAYQQGNDDWKTYVKDLRRKVPEFYAFVHSRMTIETLQEPGDRAFQRVKSYFPRLEADGFSSPEKSGAWRCLRPMTRRDEWARALPEGGRIKRFLLSWFERGSVFEPDVELDPESDPGLRDRYYEIEGLKLFVTILCSLVLGVFFCIPIVIMALDFAPREVHVILIVSFVLAFGLGLSWTLREPTLPAVLMIGYMAALVNVNVGGK